MKKPPPDGNGIFMARSTGFEPAISSVTGRRDNPFTTSANSDNDSRQILRVQGVAYGTIVEVRSYAAIAQLVERRFRKA